MDGPAIALGISNISVGALIILLSIPMARRRVPMNGWYGARFRQSFESEENWYRINEYAGRQLIWWSAPVVLIGVATFFLPVEGNAPLALALSVAPLLVLPAAITSWLYARKL